VVRGGRSDGAWKWMLYGDDDIYWFADNLKPALEELDPDVPYYVTDDVMGCCHVSNGPAPVGCIFMCEL
jgi:hypothetical protein